MAIELEPVPAWEAWNRSCGVASAGAVGLGVGVELELFRRGVELGWFYVPVELELVLAWLKRAFGAGLWRGDCAELVSGVGLSWSRFLWRRLNCLWRGWLSWSRSRCGGRTSAWRRLSLELVSAWGIELSWFRRGGLSWKCSWRTVELSWFRVPAELVYLGGRAEIRFWCVGVELELVPAWRSSRFRRGRPSWFRCGWSSWFCVAG